MSYFDDVMEPRILNETDRIEREYGMADDNRQATKVVTGEVRLAFVHALEPDASFDNQNPKYSVVVIIPKDDKKTLSKIKSAVEAATENGKASRWGGKLPKGLNKPLRDGDEDMEDYPEFEGSYFMRVSSTTKPGIIDRHKNPIDSPDDIYSGCYARVSMNMFPYSKSGNNGVSAGLNNIQVLRDGEPCGGRASAEHDFDDDFVDNYEDEDLDDLLS